MTLHTVYSLRKFVWKCFQSILSIVWTFHWIEFTVWNSKLMIMSCHGNIFRITKPIFSVPLFSQFFRMIKAAVTCMISSSYLTGVTAVELRIHLQIWTWLKVSDLYFCEIKISSNGEINERSFSNPHTWWATNPPTLPPPQRPGGRINIKMSSYQYRKSHCGDKTILRPSYLHNGISYTGKMTSLYWIRAQKFRALMFSSLSPYHKLLSKHASCWWFDNAHMFILLKR